MYVLLWLYAMYVVLFAQATATTVQALYLFGWHGFVLWNFLLQAVVWHWLLQLVRGVCYWCSTCRCMALTITAGEGCMALATTA